MKKLSLTHPAYLAAALLALTMMACQPAPAAAPAAAAALPPTQTPLPTQTPYPTATPAPPDVTPTAQVTATPPPPPEVIGPDSYPAAVNPLTGLTVADPSALQRRPLLIKISNAPPVVRPQSSISKADIIFEHYAEGGWTRFSALFYSQDADYIGSVRSGRLIDLQLAPAYDALLVFSGASNGVIDTIRQSPLYPWNTISPQFGFGEPYFVRHPRPGLDFEHTLFTSTTILRQWAAERGVRSEPQLSTPGMVFNPVPPVDGMPARVLRIEYARTSVLWRYDPVSGRYLRWTDGVPHADATTGQQLAVDNVIVISAYHEYRNLFPEKYFGTEQSWYVELQGSGLATLLRDGQAFEGRWVREEEGDLFTFYGPDGLPLALKPGQTFVQVISSAEGPYTRNGPEVPVIEP
ncbi:MAG: hypothetical protein Kow00124_18200 [Anaerolineae bacterium]